MSRPKGRGVFVGYRAGVLKAGCGQGPRVRWLSCALIGANQPPPASVRAFGASAPAFKTPARAHCSFQVDGGFSRKKGSSHPTTARPFVRETFPSSTWNEKTILWALIYSMSCGSCGGGLLRPALPRAPSWAVFFMVLLMLTLSTRMMTPIRDFPL